MLKNILKLNGAQELSKKEQKSVVGAGNGGCYTLGLCPRLAFGGGCIPCKTRNTSSSN